MRTGKVVLGTLAGLATGAIAGILLAPEKGSTTRKQIIEKSDGYVGDLKTGFDKTIKSVTGIFKSTKEDAEELVDKGKAKFDDAKNDVKNAAENFKHDGEGKKKHHGN